MATIALQDGKVVTNTTNNITKASCSCCGCGIYAPTTERPGAVVIISGVASCSFPTGDEGITEPAPDINGSYNMEYVDGYGWSHSGTVGNASDFYLVMKCFDAVGTQPAFLQLQIAASINSNNGSFPVEYFYSIANDLTQMPTFYNELLCSPSNQVAGEGGSATITFQ
jgi:hypothetical protein